VSAANASVKAYHYKLKTFHTVTKFPNPPSAWLIMVGNQPALSGEFFNAIV
jgi:hypothetical protein